MLKTIVQTVAPIALVMTLAACGQGTNEAATPAENDATTNASRAETPNAGATSALWRGGESVPLDIQVAHPNGTVLQLTSLQSRQTETVVGIRVINGDNREVRLNRFNRNRDGYIVVDSGERIYLSPPGSNSDLTVQPGQTMEGELVFLGRLPQAQSAILVLNENSATDNEHTDTPGFRINLPLQDGAAAAPAAGTNP
jgi:predicted small lipoprotein YifL